MYVHIGIVGRDRTTQLSLALLVIVSDSVTLGLLVLCLQMHVVVALNLWADVVNIVFWLLF